MKTFTSPTQKIGQIGEDIVCKHLLRAGFVIRARNYTKKWGEIDIVCFREGKTHFVEVKSVSCESFDVWVLDAAADRYRPEDQVHALKQKRLARTIQTYLAEYEVGDWQLDIVCVFLNCSTRRARLKFISDVVFS